MLFTPQQLSGGARYGKSVRIGNWSEDLECGQMEMKDYLRKKETSGLLVSFQQQQLEESLVLQQLSKAPDDNTLRYGSRVLLASEATEWFLASNVNDTAPEVGGDAPKLTLTTAPNKTPCNRNVFTLELAQRADGLEEEAEADNLVICFGDKLRLRHAQYAGMRSDGLVKSQHLTPLVAAKFSMLQEAAVGETGAFSGGDALWEVLCVDVKKRIGSYGSPVPADAAIALRHVATGSFLGSSKQYALPGLFGTEYEVHCRNYISLNKVQSLVSERDGRITGDYALRRHAPENAWRVVFEG